MAILIGKFLRAKSRICSLLKVSKVYTKVGCSKDFSSISYAHSASSESLLGLNVSQVLDRAVQKFPDNEAVVDCHQNIRKNYLQYKNDIDNLASGLVALNLKKGDRIGIWSPNCYEWLLTQFASARLGLILVCINTMNHVHELEHCLSLTGLKVLVSAVKNKEIDYYPILEELLPELGNNKESLKSARLPNLERIIMISKQELLGTLSFNSVMNAAGSTEQSDLEVIKSQIQIHDPACICFTSGTTGLPKGVVLTHHSVVNMSMEIAKRSQFDSIEERQRICSSTPLFHVQSGVFCSYAPVLSGHCLVLPSPAYSVRRQMEAIQNEKCNFMVGTPTMFLDILTHPDLEKYNLSSLKKGITGGASATPEMLRTWRDKIKTNKLLIGYGSTECTTGVMLTAPDDDPHVMETTVGKPLPHTEVKIVNEQGNIVPLETPGEVFVRGFGTMLGYWNDGEKTQKVFTADRWFKTGDLGILNAKGYGKIVGRISDVIIRGGENIYPKEVEDYISTNPKISEVHVFGVSDERLGEIVCAWVLLKKDQIMTGEEVKRFCKNKIASYKVPEHVKFVREFPKLPSGKVAKNIMMLQMKADVKPCKDVSGVS